MENYFNINIFYLYITYVYILYIDKTTQNMTYITRITEFFYTLWLDLGVKNFRPRINKIQLYEHRVNLIRENSLIRSLGRGQIRYILLYRTLWCVNQSTYYYYLPLFNYFNYTVYYSNLLTNKLSTHRHKPLFFICIH